MADDVALEGPAFLLRDDEWKDCNCKLHLTSILEIEKGKETIQVELNPGPICSLNPFALCPSFDMFLSYTVLLYGPFPLLIFRAKKMEEQSRRSVYLGVCVLSNGSWPSALRFPTFVPHIS